MYVAGAVKKKHPYFQIAFFRHTKEMQKVFQTGCKKEGRKERELIPTNSNKQILLFFSLSHTTTNAVTIHSDESGDNLPSLFKKGALIPKVT